MAKAKKPDGIYYMSIYRFGYELTAVGRTKEECVDALKNEYIKTYAEWNHLDESKCRASLLSPILDEDGEVDEYDEYNEFAQYYRDNFIDFGNGEPEFIEFGKVEWR